MLSGLGVDIIKISRIEKSVNNSGKIFLDKIFTPWEQEQAKNRPQPNSYYALTFAAKEAIFKLFHIDWNSGGKFTEIEIRNGSHGEPIPVLYGTFYEIAKEKNVSEILLSLSFEDEYAIAIAAMQ